MTIAMSRQGNGSFECSGAQIRAQCRHLATVVSIRGEIDAVNADRVRDYIRRFTLGTSSVLLDMTEVSHFAGAGIALLYGFDEDCRAAGVQWTLAASPAVSELLDDDDHEAGFPIAGSVRAALRNLADAIVSRRQQVLPLFKHTA
jgi:anti-anti-sigma factor